MKPSAPNIFFETTPRRVPNTPRTRSAAPGYMAFSDFRFAAFHGKPITLPLPLGEGRGEGPVSPRKLAPILRLSPAARKESRHREKLPRFDWKLSPGDSIIAHVNQV